MRAIASRAFILLIFAGLIVPTAWAQADKYPTVKYKKADEGRAEAALIAKYGCESLDSSDYGC